MFFEVLNELPESLKEKLQVLHLCGKMPETEAEQRYSAAGIAARAYSFFDRMDLAYGVTDVALGRAGATFLAEIQAKDIPAILVPYPFAGEHQLMNAKVFAREKEAEIIAQSELNPVTLKKSLEKYLTQVRQKARPPGLSGSLSPARALLADFIEEFV